MQPSRTYRRTRSVMGMLLTLALAGGMIACGNSSGGSGGEANATGEAIGQLPDLHVKKSPNRWTVGFGVFDMNYPASGPIAIPKNLRFVPLKIIPPSKVTKKWNVCYFQDGLNNFWLQQTKQGALQAGKYLGVNVTYHDAGWDANRQLNQIENALSQKSCDGMVVQDIDPSVVCKVLSKDAPAQDVPVVVTNAGICNSDDWTPGTVAWVGAQNYQYWQGLVGKSFKWLSEHGGGEAAAIQGTAGSKLTILFDKALDEMSKRYPNVKVVQRLPGDFTTEQGLNATQTILNTHPSIKLFVVQCDCQSVGVVTALKAAGKKPGDVVIGGTGGGDHNAFAMIRDGWALYGGSVPPLEESAHGVEVLVAHLEGMKVPRVVWHGGEYITKPDLNKFEVEW